MALQDGRPFKDIGRKAMQKWKPYSSIAVRYFYHALDEGYTKEEFYLFK